ncbi:hypothetical protein CDAR_391431 [Caerostris darwini]|uniref:Uncharacterized protein n=1 Tax=Caerostris darwini TaxID=1538125 RepID=A0AAV4W7R2_9ARAC|nr:hypothetical protein CDAR_391431 [Caerostris darwini]
MSQGFTVIQMTCRAECTEGQMKHFILNIRKVRGGYLMIRGVLSIMGPHTEVTINMNQHAFKQLLCEEFCPHEFCVGLANIGIELGVDLSLASTWQPFVELRTRLTRPM